MKKHSQNFKNNIKEMGRELDSKITFSLNGQQTELGNSELNSVTPVVQTTLLKSVMKELDIDSNVEIPVGTRLNYKLGIALNGSDYEHLDFGDYIVYSIEEQKDTNSYNIVCFDNMLESMKEYSTLKSSSKKFPMIVRDYINCLCEDLELTFKNKNETFANYNKNISSDLYADLGYTYRDIFDELAQVTASNIIINSDNQVEIKYITDTNDTINEQYLKDVNVEFGEKYGPINSIVLSRSAGSDNVYLQDEESINSAKGKNILNPSYIINGAFSTVSQIVDNKDYSQTSNTKYRTVRIPNLEAGTYTISINWNKTMYILRKFEDNTVSSVSKTSNTYTFDTNGGLVAFCFRASDSSDFLDSEYTIQLEKGDKTTEYEPFEKVGINEIKISDNQIMNFNDRSDYLSDILEKLDGLEYYINDYSSTGICYYDVCDRYNVQIDDDIYSCVIFNDEILVTQGLQENIFTDLPEQAETDYTKADKTDRRINQTYLIVDKQNQRIESFVGETTEKFEQITKEINGVSASFEDFKDNEYIQTIQNLQDQIDGVVQFWNGEDIPTLNNYPANQWKTEDERANHQGDIYYVIVEEGGELKQKSGYRFDKINDVWQWIILSDSEFAAVQALAQEALDKANETNKNLQDNYYTKTETNSQITQTATSIKSEVNQTITEKTESAKNEAINNANSNTDEKLKNYSTTTEMNSAITQTANSIQQSVSQQITDSEGNVLNKVDGKLDLYIEKGATDDIISALNIAVNKLMINSDNFKLTEDGDITANSGTVGKWRIENGSLKQSFEIDVYDIHWVFDTEFVGVNSIPTFGTYGDVPIIKTHTKATYISTGEIYYEDDILNITWGGDVYARNVYNDGRNPTEDNELVNKAYVDNVEEEWLNLSNGYSYQYDSDIPTCCKKNGVVYLRGLVEKESSAGTIICTLPEGFRPKGGYNRFFVATSYYGNSYRWVNINSDGLVNLVGSENTAISAISLSNISFIAEN